MGKGELTWTKVSICEDPEDMDDILNVYFLSTLSETMLLFKREVLFVLGGIKVNELPGHGKMYPQATNGWSLSGS